MQPSIFTKICPLCIAQVSLDSSYCECGHNFAVNASVNGGARGPGAEISRQFSEQLLHESYFEARYTQAQQCLKERVAAFGTRNWTADQRRQILSAVVDVKRAKSELDNQRRYTTHLQAMMRNPMHRIELEGLEAVANMKWEPGTAFIVSPSPKPDCRRPQP